MANWKRETEGARVHVVQDNVSVTLCGVDRTQVAVFVWDPPSRSDLCEVCARRIEHATDRADDAIAKVLATRGTVPQEEYERIYEDAKVAIRALVDIVPSGQIKTTSPLHELALLETTRAMRTRPSRRGARSSRGSQPPRIGEPLGC